MAIPLAPGGRGAPARAPLPTAPANLKTGANPRGVAVAAPPKPTVNDRAARTVGTGANPRGVAIVQPKLGGQTSAGERQSIIETFLHQPDAQKAAILKGAAKLPSTDPYRQILESIHLPAQIGSPLSEAAITASTAGIHPSGVFKVAQNAANDLWNLAPGTVEGLYGIGKQGAEGLSSLESGNVSGALSHYGNAAGMFVDPYIHMASPLLSGNVGGFLKRVEAHPVNTALMLGGVESLLGKGAGFVARTGALGDSAASAAAIPREPLKLGTVAGEPSPIEESRNYSNDLIRKQFQVAHEKLIAARGGNPNIAAPAPRWMPSSMQQALNVGVDAKLRRIADEMTSTRQALGRAERARVLHGLTKYTPVAGRPIISHILQGVVRTPETAVEDISKEINRLKAVQTGKRTVQEIWNRKQVRDLSNALKDPEAVRQAFDSAARIRPLINAQDVSAVAHGLLEHDQAMRSKLIPYAMAHMGATYDPVVRAFTNADGTALPTEDILQHLQDHGVPDPAFVGHYPGKVSPARFYSAYRMARGTLGPKTRTGEAFRTGAYDHSFEGLAGQVASRAEAITKSELHDRVVNRLGMRFSPAQTRTMMERAGLPEAAIKDAVRTGAFTPAEGRAIATASLHEDFGNQVPGALELTPISMAPRPAMNLVADLQHPAELGEVAPTELNALSHAIEDAMRRTDNARNVTLVPRVATQRFAEQFGKTDGVMRSVGRVTQQFRRTVLPYSTHWMAQIGSEAALRGLFAGVLNPRALADGRLLTHLLENDPEGRAALQEITNSGQYGSVGQMAVHNPSPGVVSGIAHGFPLSRALIAAHNRYADTVTAAMGSLEHQARVMGLGQLAHKEVQAFGFKWSNAVRIQGKSMAELADRLKADPALVARFGREIDDTFGKYNKFSPKVRGMVQSFTPFLPWYLNAAKYVLWHLPAHHPVSSALLASLRQTINQDIKDGKSLPLNAYAMQNLGRVSPFGIFTPPSSTPSTGAALAGQQMTSAILPQLMGSLYNLAGVSSFGSGALKQAPSGANYKGDVKAQSGPAGAAALENLIEGFMPLVRYARLAEAGGRPTYGTSTLLSPQPKPGTSGGGIGTILDRVLNPFYAFEEAKKSGPAFDAAPGASTASGWGSPTTTTTSGWGPTPTGANSGWGP